MATTAGWPAISSPPIAACRARRHLLVGQWRRERGHGRRCADGRQRLGRHPLGLRVAGAQQRGQPRHGLCGFQHAQRQRGPGALYCRPGCQQVQKVSADRAIADRAIADAADGLGDAQPGQGVGIGQSLQQAGERRRVADQPDGPRRRGADGRVAILEQAQ